MDWEAVDLPSSVTSPYPFSLLPEQDFAISIATLHHLSTPGRRLSTVQMFVRVLTPTHGRGMIHVWALEQDASSRRIVPDLEDDDEHDPSAPEHEGSAEKAAVRAEGERRKAQDVFVPWVLSKEAPKSVGEALKGERKKKEKKEQKKGKRAMTAAASLETTKGEDGAGASLEVGPKGLKSLSIQDSKDANPDVISLPKSEEIPRPPTPPQVYQRYYHLFKAGELSSLVEEACRLEDITFIPGRDSESDSSQEVVVENGERWLRIVREGWERDNWFVELERGVGKGNRRE